MNSDDVPIAVIIKFDTNLPGLHFTLTRTTFPASGRPCVKTVGTYAKYRPVIKKILQHRKSTGNETADFLSSLLKSF